MSKHKNYKMIREQVEENTEVISDLMDKNQIFHDGISHVDYHASKGLHIVNDKIERLQDIAFYLLAGILTIVSATIFGKLMGGLIYKVCDGLVWGRE